MNTPNLSHSLTRSSCVADAPQSPSRRRFSAALGVGFGAVALPGPAAALLLPERRLRMTNAHTWEKIDLVYWADGNYIAESLNEINYLMRDHRADKVKPIDIDLIDQLYILYTALDTKERVHVLSGYRTPETNAALRKRSQGVAKYSLHMEARAMDINIPGTQARDIQQTALAMKAGGVGYYARSGFVHIDTGAVRNWER